MIDFKDKFRSDLMNMTTNSGGEGGVDLWDGVDWWGGGVMPLVVSILP